MPRYLKPKVGAARRLCANPTAKDDDPPTVDADLPAADTDPPAKNVGDGCGYGDNAPSRCMAVFVNTCHISSKFREPKTITVR